MTQRILTTDLTSVSVDSNDLGLNGPKLLAYPHLDVAEFPLRLPSPTPVECGGYTAYRQYQYSPIDLLVAGLTAHHMGLVVSSLANFFSAYQSPYLAEHEIYLVYKINNDGKAVIRSNNIAYIKAQNYQPLLRVLHYHAPFTFGGVF